MNSKMKNEENKEAKSYTHGAVSQTNNLSYSELIELKNKGRKTIRKVKIDELIANAATQQVNKRREEMEKLVEIERVEGTPFTIVRNESDWYVQIGNWRVTEALKSKEEALQDAERTDWDRIIQVIEVVVKTINKTDNGK